MYVKLKERVERLKLSLGNKQFSGFSHHGIIEKNNKRNKQRHEKKCRSLSRSKQMLYANTL